MDNLGHDGFAAESLLNLWANVSGEDKRAAVYELMCKNKQISLETLTGMLNGRTGYIGEYAGDPWLHANEKAHMKMQSALLKRLETESTPNILIAAKAARDPLTMSILDTLERRADYDIADVVQIIVEWREGNHSDWVREIFGNKLALCGLETLIGFLVPHTARLLAIKKSLMGSQQGKTDLEVYTFFKILDSRFERWYQSRERCKVNHGSRMCMHGHGKFDIAYALTFNQEDFLLKHAKRCSTKMLVKLLIEIVAEKLPDNTLGEAILHALTNRTEYSAEELLSVIQRRGLKKIEGMTYLMARDDFPLEKQLAEFNSGSVLYDIYDKARLARVLLKKLPNADKNSKQNFADAIAIAARHEQEYAWLKQYPRVCPQK